MTRLLRTLLLGATLGLGGCSTGPLPALPDGSVPMDWRQITAAGGSPEALRAVVSDTTSGIYLTSGTRVDYLAPDGRAFFWLPGAPSPLAGRWRVQAGGFGQAAFCVWRDGTEPGPSDCTLPGSLVGRLNETVRGDVFALGSGDVPFVLPAGPAMSFNRLMLIRSGELSLTEFQ